MAILKIQKKGQKIKVQNLEEGQEYLIGRDKKNNIVTPSSHGISRKHLKLTQTEDKKWKIECLSSLGGLIVQSEETKEHMLKTGDSFYLKDYIFHFVEENLEENENQIDKDSSEPPPVEDENSMKILDEPQDDDVPSAPDKENDHDSLDNVFESKNHSFENSHAQQSKIEEISDENVEQSFENKNQEQQDKDPELQPMHNELKINPPSEKTDNTTLTKIVSDQNLQPTLVVSLDEDEEDQVIPLEDGHLWVVGRDPSSDICIEDHNISRQHFEIKQEEQKFYITDLGSSNGTCLNDMALAPYKPHLLESGSVINILDVEIYFDIINKSIQKASTNLPVAHSKKDLIPMTSDQSPNNSHLPAVPNVIMNQTLMTSLPSSPSSKKRKFIGIGLIISSLLIVGVALNSKKDTTEEIAQPTETEDSEDNKKIKDMYNLAHQLFQMKKYKLCYEKLNLLHTLTPQYKDSEKLIKSCKNGYDNQLTQLEIERRKKEQEKIDKAIAKNIQDCSQKFSSFQTLESLKECLKTTIEHDPQHPEVWNLTSKFEEIEIEKKRVLEQRQEREKRKKRELAVYKKAKTLKENNRVLQAIDAYKSFLNRKSAHIISDTVTIAKQELEEMENELNTRIDQSMSSCESLMSEQSYKEAYIACKNVTHILPDHEMATAHMSTAILEINRQLKPLYEESVINESLGNIKAAKKLWNSILEQDIPNGNYATKAQTKLDKY